MRTTSVHAALIFAIGVAAIGKLSAQSASPLETSIRHLLDQLRADPASFAEMLQQRRQYYRGNLLDLPGQPKLVTQEGVRPVDEAIAALRTKRRRVGSLTLSAGLSQAAADHVIDTGQRGTVGHFSSDGGDAAKRMARYGIWSGEIGEDINYGASDAREVVLGLLVDDGVPNRGHRMSLLDPHWRYVGIACGHHAHYGTMCVIDLASSYWDR